MNKLRKCIGFFLISCAIICLILAFLQLQKYEKGNEEYQKIEEKSTNQSNTEEPDDFSVDWESLAKQNPDCVGWIRMDPSVSYPIVQGNSNKEYLHKD